MSVTKLSLTAILVVVFLLTLAELNSENHFLRNEFLERAHFKRDLNDFLTHIQEQLEIPQFCRQLLRAPSGDLPFYNGRDQRANEDPRFQIRKNFPIESHDLKIKKIWLDTESKQNKVQKSDGITYTVHRTRLVLEITSLRKETSFKEIATIPLTVTTGPRDSYEIQDCASVSSY
ncbi:hypothetical protein [Bdellovibrio bacteriovorus]|uniref:hypothetical protein n=1 Tax=Bdellovibrio TaxID=958 RepID=UPI0035A8B239